MSEEIKEILYLQNYVEKYKSDEKAIIKGNRLTTPAMLDYLEVKALLDYITNLQQKVEQLEKEVNEYQKELEKADSITQSCIFQGKQESEISFRNCLNKLEQLENIRKEIKEYVKSKNFEENFPYVMNECQVRSFLLNILNKGSDKE